MSVCRNFTPNSPSDFAAARISPWALANWPSKLRRRRVSALSAASTASMPGILWSNGNSSNGQRVRPACQAAASCGRSAGGTASRAKACRSLSRRCRVRRATASVGSLATVGVTRSSPPQPAAVSANNAASSAGSAGAGLGTAGTGCGMVPHLGGPGRVPQATGFKKKETRRSPEFRPGPEDHGCGMAPALPDGKQGNGG